MAPYGKSTINHHFSRKKNMVLRLSLFLFLTIFGNQTVIRDSEAPGVEAEELHPSRRVGGVSPFKPLGILGKDLWVYNDFYTLYM